MSLRDFIDLLGLLLVFALIKFLIWWTAAKTPKVCMKCAEFHHTGRPTLNPNDCDICRGWNR